MFVLALDLKYGNSYRPKDRYTESGMCEALRRSPIMLTRIAMATSHPLVQRNAFHRRDARQQSRSLARHDPRLTALTPAKSILVRPRNLRGAFPSARSLQWEADIVKTVRVIIVPLLMFTPSFWFAIWHAVARLLPIPHFDWPATALFKLLA
jgi:hypothetical protein